MKVAITCYVCNGEFFRYEKAIGARNFCNLMCFKLYQKSDEFRAKRSQLTKDSMTLERRAQIGDQHRGKIESEETRRLKSESHKGKKPYEMTDEIRANIGKGSSAKFTHEYKKKNRKRREELGLAVPLEEKNDYLLYRDFANWIERMWDQAEGDQLQLLKERGVFNSRSNSSGVVRDHSFSRWSGFQQGVFPEILRHPCNLQLLTHGENVRKAQSSVKDNQTLQQLFDKIKAYTLEWIEQEKCLVLIERFERGERYNKQEYIDIFYTYQERRSVSH